ncbi:MAG: class I SAM-dependent methyltransferase [Candidatus Aenigmatarchaeota archaeon]
MILIFSKRRQHINGHILFSNREDKISKIAGIFKYLLKGKILDVGCAEKYLHKFLKENIIGIDFIGSPDVKVNLENGIPFKERSFDVVLALDVLEHIDKLHHVLKDIFRISRNIVIVGFPNIYYWRWRVRFMMGRVISEKYRLPRDETMDRHRWIYTFDELYKLIDKKSKEEGFEIFGLYYTFFKYSSLIGRIVSLIERRLSKFKPNLLPAGYIFLIKRCDS